MSYTSLGKTIWLPIPIMPASNTQPQCHLGIEKDDNGCCPISSWHNQTYLAVKGYYSLQHWNEKRIRHFMHRILTDNGAGEPGLLAFAYDKGAQPPTQLISKLKSAYRNFLDFFQPDRWAIKEQGVKTDCQTDGWYSQYIGRLDYTHWTDARITAMSRASGDPVSSQERQALKDAEKAGADWTKLVTPKQAEWFAKALAVTQSAPGGQPGFRYKTMPQIEGSPADHKNQEKEFPGQFEVKNGQVVPGPWVQMFLDVWSDKTTLGQKIASSGKTVDLSRIMGDRQQTKVASNIATASKVASISPALLSRVSTQRITSPSSSPSPVPSKDPSLPAQKPADKPLSNVAKVAIGVGILAIAGTGVYFATRK